MICGSYNSNVPSSAKVTLIDGMLAKDSMEFSVLSTIGVRNTRLMSAGPTTPYASVEHGDFKYVGYTGVFNVLDYPVVSFPCGITADRNLDGRTKQTPLSDVCAAVQDHCE